MKKSAFTLAEIMIVLTVIGILTGILMPIAFHSAPDENVMKTKKAYNALTTAIREMVNSDKYYLDGDLGLNPSGEPILDPTYNCNVMADILNAKVNNCSQLVNYRPSETLHFNTVDSNGIYIGEEDPASRVPAKFMFDSVCFSTLLDLAFEPLVMSDGTVFYEAFPNTTYGGTSWWGGERAALTVCEETGLYCAYKVFCFDVDGLNYDASQLDSLADETDYYTPSASEKLRKICKGMCPFSVGIRFDGKMILGAGLENWLQASVQKGE